MSGAPLVLLHGLGRTRLSMWRLSRRARERGLVVPNIGYPSRRADVAAHAERLGGRLASLAASTGPLEAVTHSLGGIVLRAAVAGGWLPATALRRVVMLAPPNAGSELADALSRTPLFRLTVGPAGPQLRRAASSRARALRIERPRRPTRWIPGAPDARDAARRRCLRVFEPGCTLP